VTAPDSPTPDSPAPDCLGPQSLDEPTAGREPAASSTATAGPAAAPKQAPSPGDPVDAAARLAQWLTSWSRSSQGLRCFQGLDGRSDRGAGAVPQLRKKGLTAEQASAVVDLWELRQRARSKFERPADLFFTRRSYEQASGEVLARRKVDMLRSLGPDAPVVILDLCCGSGGDLLTFARHFPVIGVDWDPALVHYARTNLDTERGARSRPSPTGLAGVANSEAAGRPESPSAPPPALLLCADVRTLLPSDATVQHRGIPAGQAKSWDVNSQVAGLAPSCDHWDWTPTLGDWLDFLPELVAEWAQRHQLMKHRVVWHFDPDRRDASGRHTRFDQMTPGEDFFAVLVNWAGVGLVKLAPATQVADRWRMQAHWQWLGADRECKQLLGCFGFAPLWPPATAGVAVWQKRTGAWREWQLESARADATVSEGIRTEGDVASLEACAASDANHEVDKDALPPNPALRPQAFLMEPHPAFYAARQADAYALSQGWQKLAGGDYYTSDQCPDLGDSLFAAFRVLTTLPLRQDKIQAWLRASGCNAVEIKSRSVEENQRQPLRKLVQRGPDNSGTAVSLLLFRQPKPSGYSLQVAICQRHGDNAGAP
jgi:hypothetical protein